MQATEIFRRCGDGAQIFHDFSGWPTKKRDWHDFFDTEKDEFSIARDSSGFIIAQKEAQLMWRFDAVLYQSAVCIAAFKESSWQVSRIYPSCYGHFRPQGSNWDMSPLGELVSRFLTRFPSSLICFCRCVILCDGRINFFANSPLCIMGSVGTCGNLRHLSAVWQASNECEVQGIQQARALRRHGASYSDRLTHHWSIHWSRLIAELIEDYGDLDVTAPGSARAFGLTSEGTFRGNQVANIQIPSGNLT